jgi:hypothetical protein
MPAIVSPVIFVPKAPSSSPSTSQRRDPTQTPIQPHAPSTGEMRAAAEYKATMQARYGDGEFVGIALLVVSVMFVIIGVLGLIVGQTDQIEADEMPYRR